MSQVVQTLTISKIPIDVKEFTDQVARTDAPSNPAPRHTVTGVGIFDTLMETATEHLLAQYEGNRIKAEQYADAYIQIYQATLQAALKIWLEKGLAEAQAALAAKNLEIAEKELELKGKQLDLIAAQIDAEKGKGNLYKRQIEGFDEDFKHKMLKTMLDSWAVAFSVAKDNQVIGGNNIPAPITKAAIDDLFNRYIAGELSNSVLRTTNTITNW